MLREEVDREESVCSSLAYVPTLIQSHYALSCGALMVLTSPQFILHRGASVVFEPPTRMEIFICLN